MTNRAKTRTHGGFIRRKSLWRLLWLALLLIHAPATVKVFSSVMEPNAGWSSAMLIGATNLFFILEIAFARSLHLLQDRRSAIVFLVIIALLHVGVIERGFPEWTVPEGLHAWLLLTAGCTPILEWLRRRVDRHISGVIAQIDDLPRELARRRYAAFASMAPPPVGPDVLARILPERAPPAC